ncbi:MAG: MmcQ/YjbR family DNA-binding protein [Magnetovibrio sp.]|nr:MmcQ/YjbR family DNA-binding protein [Magnetovibrio sp.]
MSREEFDAYCATLKAATHVVQWHGTSVWKVGGKIFALCGNFGDGHQPKISFKCSDLSFDILTEQPGIVPAPYLARAKWVQVTTADALSDDDIGVYLAQAHDIIAAKLTRAVKAELGL